MLGRVWWNIFQNAVEASPENACVTVRCRETKLGGRSALVVAISDQGPGMNHDERERMFIPFFTTKSSGTGLGMAIVKTIVNAHGGSVAVADRDGPEAEIDVILPR